MDRIAAVVGLMAIALIVVSPPNPVVGVIVFASWLLVPGWAVASRLQIADPAARITLTVMTSIAVATITSLVMVWSALWHPEVAAIAILLAAAAALACYPRPGSPGIGVVVRRVLASASSRGRRISAVGWGLWALWAIGVVCWIVSLGLTAPSDLNKVDVALVFPPLWYSAAGIAFVVGVAGLSSRRSSTLRTAAAAGLLNSILHASASVVQPFPQVPWAYKHIAVSNLIDVTGRVDPSIDIYNRWPGFFSTSAFFGRITGFPDPVDWAAWFDVGFALFSALAVLAIARTFTPVPSAQWTAVLVFTFGNWIGQNYYSPQAFGYSFYLSMCLVSLTYLRGEPVRRLVSLGRRLRTRVPLRTPAPRRWPSFDGMTGAPVPAIPSSRTRIAAITIVIVFQCVIVVSHQLTPYLAIACLVPLFFSGLLRPRWVGIALGGAALLFLVPNLDYLDSTYGLLSSFDPVSNAVFTPEESVKTSPAEVQRGLGVTLLSVTVLGVGLLGFLRRALSGGIRPAMMATVLALAPAVILVGQNYGGEGRFRVYLFALPWLAIGVAWFFEAGGRGAGYAAGLRIAMLAVLLGLFTATYFQASKANRVFAQDVTAAEWLDQRLEPGDFLIGEAKTFPALIGPHYPIILSQSDERWFLSIQTQSGSDFFNLSSADTDAADVEAAVETVGGLGRTYILFADSQRPLLDSDVVALLDNVESTIRGDDDFEPVYSQSGVRIYRVDGPSR